ncbi:hypothetical protein OROHE_018440 [Orobanche hederae]
MGTLAIHPWRSRVAGIFRSAFAPLQRGPRLVVPSELKLSEDDGEVVGSSHGWAAVFNKGKGQLFLLDPLTNHRVNLPPIRTLADPHLNLDVDGRGSVSKVALSSSSPDDDDCRAAMIFGPTRRLALCSPRHSSEWTPLGDPFFLPEFDHPDEEDFYERQARVHADLVYCSKRKVLTSVTAGDLNLRFLLDHRWMSFGIGDYDYLDDAFVSERYDWNVEDPNSPKLVRSEKMEAGVEDNGGEGTINWVAENLEVLENECVQIPHLVYAEDEDEVFVVVRFVRLMRRDGLPLGYVPRCEYRGLAGVFPGKTYGFIVMRMDPGKTAHIHFTVVDDLNGMTMFVGINHSLSFAVVRDRTDRRRFNPNSIYFSDSKRIERVRGVNDCGIFDYATKTFSPLHGHGHLDGDDDDDDDDGDDDDAPFHTHTSSSFWFT